jgi:hypothetical protein
MTLLELDQLTPGEVMISSKTRVRAVFSFIAVFVLSLSLFADTIRLKDGSIIKGTIIGFADGRFTIAVGEGTRRRELTLLSDEIASIEFEAIPATSARLSQPLPKIVPVSTKPSQTKTDNTGSVQTPPSTKSAPRVTITDNTRSTQPQGNSNNSAKNVPPAYSRPADNPPVNQTSQTTVPKVQPPVNRPAANSSPAAAPIALNVRVMADNTANGWTNSGYVVKKGQRIRITGAGSVSLGKGQTATPAGLPDLDDTEKLLKMVPTGALIAVIGDDNNDFIYIGSSREFTAGRDGALYLGVNDGNLNDNSGAFDVKVEILPS